MHLSSRSRVFFDKKWVDLGVIFQQRSEIFGFGRIKRAIALQCVGILC